MKKLKKSIENCLRFSKNQSTYYDLISNLLNKTLQVTIVENTLIFINTLIRMKNKTNSKRFLRSEFKSSGLNESLIVIIFLYFTFY